MGDAASDLTPKRYGFAVRNKQLNSNLRTSLTVKQVLPATAQHLDVLVDGHGRGQLLLVQVPVRVAARDGHLLALAPAEGVRVGDLPAPPLPLRPRGVVVVVPGPLGKFNFLRRHDDYFVFLDGVAEAVIRRGEDALAVLAVTTVPVAEQRFLVGGQRRWPETSGGHFIKIAGATVWKLLQIALVTGGGEFPEIARAVRVVWREELRRVSSSRVH